MFACTSERIVAAATNVARSHYNVADRGFTIFVATGVEYYSGTKLVNAYMSTFCVIIYLQFPKNSYVTSTYVRTLQDRPAPQRRLVQVVKTEVKLSLS